MIFSNYKLGVDFGGVVKVSGEQKLVPGFAESMLRLMRHKFGPNLHLISRVDDEEQADRARQFLEFTGLDKMFFSLNFCGQRSEKAGIARGLGLTHFVDDRTECLWHMHGRITKFALCPTEQQLRDFPPVGMYVVQSWPEIVDLILHAEVK